MNRHPALDDADIPDLLRTASAPPLQPEKTPPPPSPRRTSATTPTNPDRGEDAGPSPTARTDTLRARRLPIDEEVLERGRAARRALDDASPDAAADERILHELVAKQLPVALMLHELEEQLAVRMLTIMDNPQLVLAVAKILRDTSMIASSMSKRIQAILSTAASLRAQRRFLGLHARAQESKRDV